MNEQQLNTYLARVNYLAMLEASLKSWLIYDDEEKENIDKLIAHLENYEDMLIDRINSNSK